MKAAPAAASVATLAFVAGLAWLAAATSAAAATPWYRVEVVLFAQGGDSPWSRDDWREEGPPALAKNTVELLPGLDAADRPAGSKRRHAFRALPPSALGLGSAVDRLERSNDYRVLLHVGWHQPGFSDDDAPGVHLNTLRSLALDDRFAGAAGEEVEGTVRFWRRRFLHVDVDLGFGDIEAWRRRESEAAAGTAPDGESAALRDADAAAPAPGGAAEGEAARAVVVSGLDPAEPLRVVRLTRSLRLRAGRLHYIDHPLFGILLEIKRLN